jgi:hypothetical protein
MTATFLLRTNSETAKSFVTIVTFDRVNILVLIYSETCEIGTPLGRANSVPNSEVSSFQGAICTEKSSLGPDEVSLFHRVSSFRRVAIHRFHCI